MLLPLFVPSSRQSSISMNAESSIEVPLPLAQCGDLRLIFFLIFEDLKPENLLFRTQEEDADIMIADFGLSRVMEEEKLNLLTEICGTPGVSHCPPFFLVAPGF